VLNKTKRLTGFAAKIPYLYSIQMEPRQLWYVFHTALQMLQPQRFVL